MSIEVKMPALSPTMEKGVLAKWLVAAGDKVRPGDVIAEVETDKATMEVEALEDGEITALLVGEGTDAVPVGAVIALISKEPTTASATLAASPSPQPQPPEPQAPEPQVPEPRPSEPASRVADDTPAPAASPPPPPVGEIRATPLARRLASVAGLDLRSVTGTGSRGRIVMADLGLEPPPPVAGQASSPAPTEAPAPARPMPAPLGIPMETIKLSGMRKVIARRLADSKQTIPHFYLRSRCAIDPLLKLRREVNAGLERAGLKISVNDMLIKAMSLALKAVPACNVQFGGDVLYRFDRVDIAVAVAIEGGLVTPVIENAAGLSLSAIAEVGQALAAKARSGKLTPEEYQGGTASLSNLGMFGIDEIVPVINPPQAVILGVGAGREQPWVVDGEVRVATVLAATASFDHRAIDGADGARFMAAFRDLIETPLSILC